MRKLRKILTEKIAALPSGPIAVATSGGVDSSSLVLAAIDAGRRPIVTSFTLVGERSTDFLAASRLASELELDFVPVYLPVARSTIAADVKTLVGRWDARKKTSIECLWPFLHVFAVLAAEASILVTGSAADGHFGLSKKAMIHWREPKARFQEFRKNYFSNPDAAQVATLKEIGRSVGIEVTAPYFSREVFELFADATWDDLNKPRQKEAIRREFPELEPFRLGRHVNLQLGDSGIAEVVGAAAIATFAPGAKSPVTAYNKLAKGFANA